MSAETTAAAAAVKAAVPVVKEVAGLAHHSFTESIAAFSSGKGKYKQLALKSSSLLKIGSSVVKDPTLIYDQLKRLLLQVGIDDAEAVAALADRDIRADTKFCEPGRVNAAFLRQHGGDMTFMYILLCENPAKDGSYNVLAVAARGSFCLAGDNYLITRTRKDLFREKTWLELREVPNDVTVDHFYELQELVLGPLLGEVAHLRAHMPLIRDAVDLAKLRLARPAEGARRIAVDMPLEVLPAPV
jgi:hypothetical protein